MEITDTAFSWLGLQFIETSQRFALPADSYKTNPENNSPWSIFPDNNVNKMETA